MANATTADGKSLRKFGVIDKLSYAAGDFGLQHEFRAQRQLDSVLDPVHRHQPARDGQPASACAGVGRHQRPP